MLLLGAAALLCRPALLPAQPARTPQTAPTPEPLTLDAAIARAAAGNFAISAAQREVEANGGAVAQAGVRRNPQFNASLQDTQHRTQSALGSVDIPFELGGKRAARVAAAERAGDLARAEVVRATAELRASVASAFDKVLIAQERIGLATDSADLAARSADATARRVAAGKVSPVEETRGRLDQANAQLELDEAQSDLRSARYALAACWGDAEPAFTAVQGDVDGEPFDDTALADRTSELTDAPALVAMRLQVEQRRSQVAVERSRQYPDVTLNLGVNRDNDIGRTQAVVGFSVPLPLFDRNQGAILEADRRVAQAQDEYDDARRRLGGEVQQALGQIDAAQRTARALKTTVIPAAQALYDAASKGYAAGKFGFLDVLDAQRTLLQARSRYLTALATSHQARATLDRLLGR